ncbi:signal peptidase I [Neoactinobaculum massilliense]|uniref:signal peptidase I n=1 Tax=Neoactinobaculum massilliense TaxID=2364794 RepID=UPI0019D260AD|nr:signal peptidase I [Neoactinobaculum massilliense]
MRNDGTPVEGPNPPVSASKSVSYDADARADLRSREVPPSFAPKKYTDWRKGAPKALKKSPWWVGVLEILGIVVAVLVVSTLIKTFLVQAFNVPSASMENTLIPGDKFFVNRQAAGEKDLRRGDVVVFVDPGGWLEGTERQYTPFQRGATRVLETIGVLPANNGEYLVKRIIGVGGDTVSCCSINGKIEVNGKEITEPYLAPGMAPSLQEFSVTVPAHSYWVMGDNRSNSKDSRWHQAETGNGFVPAENITGRAFFIFSPLDRAGKIPDYTSAFADVGN